MKKLAPIEFFRGFVAVLPICFKIGWIGLSVAGVAGLLWMAGGTYSKAIRRLGVPILAFLVSVSLIGFKWPFLGILAIGYGVLSLGDGYPDRRTSTYDFGSWLGREVEKFGFSDEVGGEITKWIPVILFQIALLSIYL